MNFLAHLYLSCQDEDLVIGNFLGDFIKNRELEDLKASILEGVYLHRAIDSFTDKHPMVKQGTKRLQPIHHKYAPVVVDIFYDYILVKNWEKYSAISLQTFANNMYVILERGLKEMPERLHSRVESMIAHNWLISYGTVEGQRYTFERLSKRTKFDNQFPKAVDSLLEYEADYDREFNIFFPDVIKMVKERCGCE